MRRRGICGKRVRVEPRSGIKITHAFESSFDDVDAKELSFDKKLLRYLTSFRFVFLYETELEMRKMTKLLTLSYLITNLISRGVKVERLKETLFKSTIEHVKIRNKVLMISL